MSDRGSVISGLSGHSVRSRDSRMAAQAKAAELRVQLEYVEKEEKTRSELLKLDLKKKLDIENAKSQVFEQFEMSETFLYGVSPNKFPPAVDERIVDKNVNFEEENKTEFVKKYLQTLPNVDTENSKQDKIVDIVPSVDDHQTPGIPITPISTGKTQTQKTSTFIRHPFTSSKLNIGADEFTPKLTPEFVPRKSEISNVDCVMAAAGEIANMTKTFAEKFSLSRLPVPEPGIFYGNPLYFPSWKTAFETLIETREIQPQEKLYYLKKYVGGSVRDDLEGYFLMRTPEAYDEAKQLLEDRYGNQVVLGDAFRDKLDGWPKINGKNGTALRKYADFLKQCLIAARTIPSLKALDFEKENRMLVSKLPDNLIYRWSRIVVMFRSRKVYPPFAEFVKFVTDEADVACEPVTGILVMKQDKVKDSFTHRDRVKDTQTAHGNRRPAISMSTEVKKKRCYLCNKDHELEHCDIFLKKSIADKKLFAVSRGICFGCLRWGHLSKDCEDKMTCQVCSRKHPTVFHFDRVDNKPETKQDRHISNSQTKMKSVNGKVAVSFMNDTAQNNKCAMIVPVWLSHDDNPDSEILTYALLDTQSDTTFILKNTCERLGVTGPKVQLMLSTMHAEDETIECQKIKNLTVRGYNSNLKIPLPMSYTRGIMPVNRNHIPTPENVTQWTHLASMSNELLDLQDCEVGLLIGYNCTKALTPRDVIPSDADGPYAVRTDLGWSVVGVMDPDVVDEDPIGTSHRILTYRVPEELSPSCDVMKESEPPNEVVISLQTSVKETFIAPSQVVKLLEQDFIENEKSDKVMSYDDAKFMKIAKTSIRQGTDKHYEMPLPFRHPQPKLPNNKVQATRRLEQLTRRFRRDAKFHADYVTFMDKLIQNGYAEPAPEIDDGERTVWYIPHHGVYHPQKPNKIRVVFDCSARFRGESLNEHLLQGPDMTNTLIGVLHRFRQERIAVMCDVEQMFFQFRVDENQRDYLRFLWFDKGDFSSEPIEYRMNVHLFGATSSPGCSNYCLRQCADDYEEEVGHEAAEFLRNHFYVDDGLKSVQTVKEAFELVSASQELCAKGGIRLHKFVSNAKEVMNSLRPADCANSKETELLKGMDLVEKPLGILWCVETDTLSIRVTLQDSPLTRRGVLSTVSSVYDPLGFIAPVIMVGKSILQTMCRDNADWDDPVPDTLRPQWEKWRTEILELTSVKVDRCFKPQDFGKVERVEFHHFSDASNLGYGQCSYIRLIDSDGKIHVSLLMGKSRVAPLKQVTIPRLELTAALVSVRISTLLSRELEYEDVKHVYWTDSKVVIGYINNDSKRFHVFVANRVSQIREKTDPTQWRYIETEKNPADDASRGLTPHNLIYKSDWLKGPLFLWNKELPEQHTDSDSVKLSADDPEVKCAKGTVMKTMATESTEPDIVDQFSRFSDWFRLKRVVAMCLKLKRKLRRDVKVKRGDICETDETVGPCTFVTVNDMLEAENEIVKLSQQKVYGEEIKLLQSLKDDPHSSRELKKTSSLSRLDPFLDNCGELRVGGRIRQSSVTCNEKHPVILPKGQHGSKLVIRHFHEKTCHQGRGMTINELRSSGFWIVGCSSAVSSYIYKCVKCRKLRSQVQQQRMADLPSERVNESPPFTYCGVDCFGPFLVKEGRKTQKRYGVLFTCLACRAIHVEVASSLSTDSFINALRRFQAIRGPVRELRCDRGTNFVGAMNELKDCLEADVLRDYLLKSNCDVVNFNMNVPGASHMGGVWERQIRSVRSVLNSLMEQASTQLNDESLRTLMLEATAIVNSRPLSTETLNDPTSLEPLTANHLLTMKTQILLPPPGHFQKADLYACKQWRRVQYYANEFWSRWKKEFLQNMQPRQRWRRHSRDVRVGDIMIIKNDNVPRNLWQLGRVVETFPSRDGHVRKVKLQIGDQGLDSKGRRKSSKSFLERPVQKLVLLLEHEE